MKTCLIISAYFPPMGGVGVQRISKFVKYMPLCGWRPMVVTTPTWSFRGERDESLMQELPSETIIKRPFFIDYKKILPGELAKLVRPLLRAHLQPDRYRWWNHYALKTAQRLAKEHTIHAALVNVSPFSGLLLGAQIKQELNIPVVVNLRDAFSFNNYFLLEKNQKARQQAMEIEKATFPLFDAIVCVTPHLVKQYQALYPDLRNRFHLITNGYDEDDFTSVEDIPEKSDTFTIGYNGSISRLAPIEPLLDAMSRLSSEHQIRVRICMAGKNSLKQIAGRHPQLLQAGLIDHRGFLPHRQSLQNLAGAHLLAIMFADDPATEGAYSGKIFEYLRLNKPILLMHRPNSDLAKLISRCRAGRCVNIDDRHAITAALLDLHDQWRSGGLNHNPDWNVIQTFDYRALTKKLTELFEPN
ncbi:glycosyltransferase [candidate division KSB1 bacterium]|nr:glycosyltransferase [candidate division KSB1 bacterium]